MFTILGADGKEYGPVATAKIHEWVNGGRANLMTKARRDGETAWKNLGEFPEFAAVTGAAPAAATPAPVVPTLAPGSAADSLATGPTLILAGRWPRLGAQILDGIIGCCVALPGFAVLLAAGIFSRPDHPNGALMVVGFGVLGILLLGLAVYQIYRLSTCGQTIGKKLLGIKIVNHVDGSNPGFVKAFLLRGFVNGLIGAVPFVGGIYSLVDICFIFRDDKRCIHDLIAGTQVVQA